MHAANGSLTYLLWQDRQEWLMSTWYNPDLLTLTDWHFKHCLDCHCMVEVLTALYPVKVQSYVYSVMQQLLSTMQRCMLKLHPFLVVHNTASLQQSYMYVACLYLQFQWCTACACMHGKDSSACWWRYHVATKLTCHAWFIKAIKYDHLQMTCNHKKEGSTLQPWILHTLNEQIIIRTC